MPGQSPWFVIAYQLKSVSECLGLSHAMWVGIDRAGPYSRPVSGGDTRQTSLQHTATFRFARWSLFASLTPTSARSNSQLFQTYFLPLRLPPNSIYPTQLPLLSLFHSFIHSLLCSIPLP